MAAALGINPAPVAEILAAIQDAIAKFIPTAQQAAVASQIFGSRAGLIFTRIDSATLRQATQDVADFGVTVSESDAAQIQLTNDALSRMGLLWRGIANQLAVAAAPALEAMANAMAAIGKVTGPFGRAIKGLFNHIGEIAIHCLTGDVHITEKETTNPTVTDSQPRFLQFLRHSGAAVALQA